MIKEERRISEESVNGEKKEEKEEAVREAVSGPFTPIQMSVSEVAATSCSWIALHRPGRSLRSCRQGRSLPSSTSCSGRRSSSPTSSSSVSRPGSRIGPSRPLPPRLLLPPRGRIRHPRGGGQGRRRAGVASWVIARRMSRWRTTTRPGSGSSGSSSQGSSPEASCESTNGKDFSGWYALSLSLSFSLS